MPSAVEHESRSIALERAQHDAEAARSGGAQREVKIVRDLSEVPEAVRDAAVEHAVNQASSNASPDSAWRDVNRAPVDIVPEDFSLDEEERVPADGEETNGETEQSRGVGRPTKYTPELGRMIREHVSKGFSPASPTSRDRSIAR